jgi:Tfp pilus assembly protein PilF
MAKAEELFHKKQYISAEKWYLEAVKADPKNPRIYARLGSIYLEQKNFSDARDAFEEATKLDDTIASRFFNLSYIYNSIGDINLAQANARKATRMDPRNSKYKHWMDELKKGRL